MSAKQAVAKGLVAGAVGTTALNAATYLDMAIRGRPGSSSPETTVERGAQMLHVSVPGDEETRQARLSGLGPLMGSLTGVAAGAVLGVLRAAGWPRGTATTLGTSWVLAMLAGNGPMTLMGVTDPRSWSAEAWVSDVVPHAAYAVAATATMDLFDG